ncbi:ATP-grasp domain-containing protein [Kordiimonas sp.]|uniref:ATP-grasp domain-containing protein n=1 Tax=Kordiimonas sp. TaxID=1970157 RepID=UPI003A8DC7E6
MKSRAIIQIGGSVLQRHTMAWAQDAGLKVLLTDSSADAYLKDTADAFHQADGTDGQAILEQAQVWLEHYDIVEVYAGGDFGLKSAAYVAEALGIPHCVPDAVDISLSKDRALEKFRAAGLTVPKRTDEHSAASHLPVIVKPKDSSGSRGVTFVEDAADLAAALQHARQYSSDIIIEHWVDGRHIDVNGILWHGDFYGCEVIERFFSPLPLRYPLGMVTPPKDLTEADREKIFDTLARAAKATGINHGPVKGDFIMTRDEIVVLEIAPRFHGETNTYSAPHAYGSCSARDYMMALGAEKPPITQHYGAPKSIAGWAAIFPETTGRLREVQGVENALALPGITDVVVRRGPGFTVNAIKDNTAVIGFIYGHAANHEMLDQLLVEARKTITVEME